MKASRVRQKALAEALNVTQSAVSKWANGTIPEATKLIEIAQFFKIPVENIISASNDGPSASPVQFTVEKSKKSTATPVGVRLIPVFGMAQALGYRPHSGDIVPDNIYALPKVAVMDDGREYAAFRVEGRSMEPTLMDGVIVLCDTHLEPTNKCIVCIKWDDTVVIKRWRRVDDRIILTSDNPHFGEEFTVQAKEIAWCLRVRRVVMDLP